MKHGYGLWPSPQVYNINIIPCSHYTGKPLLKLIPCVYIGCPLFSQSHHLILICSAATYQTAASIIW